jgi:hypothetical protein
MTTTTTTIIKTDECKRRIIWWGDPGAGEEEKVLGGEHEWSISYICEYICVFYEDSTVKPIK